MPALQELRLNGLSGGHGWSFNLAPAPVAPALTPAAAAAGAAAAAAPPPGWPQLRVCRVAAKSHPDMVGLGTGATNVNDACLAR